MSQLQQALIGIFFLINVVVLFLALQACKKKNQAFTEVPLLALLGGFVWGDFLIFAPFWMIISLTVFFCKNEYLFSVIFSIFWIVRSLGESIYWFNQQFSSICRNKPENLRGYHLVKNDSIWYIYQIFWQCILVISLVTSIYAIHLWLLSL